MLSDPDLRQRFENFGRGDLPSRESLQPVFERILPKNDPAKLTDAFVDGLNADISKLQEFVNLVLLKRTETLVEWDQRLKKLLNELEKRKAVEEEPAFKLSLAKLPTTRAELFGRADELQTLDDAWADAHTNVLSFVAWGGVGKTALVNRWLNQMELDNYRGAQRVYGWSFYSQGTKEERQVSADE